MIARFIGLFITLLLLTSSLLAEDSSESAIRAAEIAVKSAIGSRDTLPGYNGVSVYSVNGIHQEFVVSLLMDVDGALDALAKLPPEHIAQITSLQFYTSPTSPDAWKSLERLNAVESVMLADEAKWSPEFGESVTKLPNLKSLHVCEANVDCAGIEQISRCTKLKHLWLHDNDLSKCDLAPLVNLQELRQLMMSNANVDTSQMKFVEFLPKLGWIAISKNRIDRATIDRLEEIFPKALINANNQRE